MNKRTRFSLYGLAITFLLLTALLTPITFLDTKKPIQNKPLTIEEKQGLLELNIVCSDQHNHPLLQGKELCAYIPDIKNKLREG